MENVSEKIYNDGGQLGTVDGDFIARNVEKAIAAGLPCCAHCGKGVDVSTSWSTRISLGSDKYALATLSDEEVEELIPGFTWILLGSSCGSRVVDKEYRVKTTKLGSEVHYDDFNRRYFGGEQ